MILRSAGFIVNDLLGGKNSIDFAYIVYLRGRKEGLPADELESIVRKWFVMAMLTGRYSGSPETAFDLDIRQIQNISLKNYSNTLFESSLTTGFWENLLPQQMNTSSAISPYFLVFQASQIKQKDKGFLSRDIEVSSLLLNRADIHHLFPKEYLKKMGLQRGDYNQIANYALAQSEINIAIGQKAPKKYFAELLDQVRGGKKLYGGIQDERQLLENLKEHCIPEGIFNSLADDYTGFLEERRKLMAKKIQEYFSIL
jgi:hypothetical protein